MSKSTFLAENFLLGADLSFVQGTENYQFPLENVKHDFSTKVFRSNENTVQILIDLKQTRPVDYFCMRGSALDGLGFLTARVEGSPTTSFNGVWTDLDVSQKYNLAYTKITGSFRYWKLEVTALSFVEISNIFVGPQVQMDNNDISQGFKYSLNTNSTVSKNQVGQKFIDTFGTQKVISGAIKYANAEEFEQINEIQERLGENYPLWFLLDSAEDMEIIDSKFKFAGMFYMTDLSWTQQAFNLYDVNIILTEAM